MKNVEMAKNYFLNMLKKIGSRAIWALGESLLEDGEKEMRIMDWWANKEPWYLCLLKCHSIEAS